MLHQHIHILHGMNIRYKTSVLMILHILEIQIRIKAMHSIYQMRYTLTLEFCTWEWEQEGGTSGNGSAIILLSNTASQLFC